MVESPALRGGVPV